MEELRRKLRAFIIETFLFGRTDEELHDEDSLIEQGIIDSIGVLLLVSFLEQNLNVVVEDDEIVPENLDSVNRLAAFAARKLELDSHAGAAPAFLEAVLTADVDAI
jgi:acyl carrier protein